MLSFGSVSGALGREVVVHCTTVPSRLTKQKRPPSDSSIGESVKGGKLHRHVRYEVQVGCFGGPYHYILY